MELVDPLKQLVKGVVVLKTVHAIREQKVLDKALYNMYLETKEKALALSVVSNEPLRSMVRLRHIAAITVVAVLSQVFTDLNKDRIVVSVMYMLSIEVPTWIEEKVEVFIEEVSSSSVP